MGKEKENSASEADEAVQPEVDKNSPEARNGKASEVNDKRVSVRQELENSPRKQPTLEDVKARHPKAKVTKTTSGAIRVDNNYHEPKKVN